MNVNGQHPVWTVTLGSSLLQFKAPLSLRGLESTIELSVLSFQTREERIQKIVWKFIGVYTSLCSTFH